MMDYLRVNYLNGMVPRTVLTGPPAADMAWLAHDDDDDDVT